MKASTPSRISMPGFKKHHGLIVRLDGVIICKVQGTGNRRTRGGGFVVSHPFRQEKGERMGHGAVYGQVKDVGFAAICFVESWRSRLSVRPLLFAFHIGRAGK